MISLSGRTALVTGGTLGVGRAIAEQLARCGANIVLHGLHRDSAAEEAQAAIQSLGVDCALLTGDLSGPTENVVAALVDQATQAAPGIDILISNAGTYREPDFLEVDFATMK